MKLLNVIKLLAVLTIGIFSSMTFASEGEAELTKKLGDAFDSFITADIKTEKRLSDSNLAELWKPGITQIEVEIDGKKELFSVAAEKVSKWYKLNFTGFKHYFNRHETPQRYLECATGVFKSNYNYGNKLGQTVEYTLTFTSEAITRLCHPPQKVEVFTQGDDSSADYSSVEDDEGSAAFYDCQSTPSPEQDRACSGGPKGIRGTSVRLQLLKCTMADMWNIMQQAIEVAKQGDHIWCAGANGVRGAANLYDAATTFNVWSAFVGVADIATAVVSGGRAYKALSGTSNTTQRMFKDLDTKLEAIGGISDEMKDLLDQVRTSLDQVKGSLEQYEAHKNELLGRAATAIGEEATQIREALEILKAAQADHKQAFDRLEQISKAVSQIDGTWKLVTLRLSMLAETASAAIQNEENPGAELLERMETIQKQAKGIEEVVESLQEPMTLVNEFISEMGRLNVQIGGHFSNAITHLVKVCEDKAQLERDFVLLAAENKELKAACSQLGSIDDKAASMQCLNAQVKLLTKGAEKDVQELKVAFDAKYDLAHILVGAGVAMAAAAVLAPGIVPTAGLGLLAVQGAKMIEWCSVGRNACGEQPLFQTRFGRWAYCLGVSEETIKAVGAKVLRFDYEALKQAQAELEAARLAKNQDPNSAKK